MTIDDLNKIRKVEAPSFLYTRIIQKIENLNQATMPKKISWALGFSFILIFCLNISIIIKNQTYTKSMETYAQAINLTTNNTLYK